MNQTYFLVDTNAVTALKLRRIRSDFFAERCRVTSDVLRELPEHPELHRLSSCELAQTAEALDCIRLVMARVSPGDTRLIDLYRNKGMADPGLLGSAMAAALREESMLFPDQWVVVTNDAGVEQMAALVKVETMKPAQLSALIDEVG